MKTEPRCPICDLKVLWVSYSDGRDQALTMALDMGAKRGDAGVKAVLCKGHLDAWEQHLIVGTTRVAKMIQYEAAELARLKEEKP